VLPDGTAATEVCLGGGLIKPQILVEPCPALNPLCVSVGPSARCVTPSLTCEPRSPSRCDGSLILRCLPVGTAVGAEWAVDRFDCATQDAGCAPDDAGWAICSR
jgi:hypothetical protein